MDRRGSSGGRYAAWFYSGFTGLALMTGGAAFAQTPEPSAQEFLRQQERERQLREQQERVPDVRLKREAQEQAGHLPVSETPCFPIRKIVLLGDQSGAFAWALRAADPGNDPATGRCLGSVGMNLVMGRIQNAIVARGYVTTRVLAAPQDLKSGILALTVIPGRIHAIRFAPGTDPAVTLNNAVPARPGDVLNLRKIEQALENLQRVPTVSADIQIVPNEGDDAQPGESDLVISWQQRSRYRASLTLDDAGSEATGKLQGGVTMSLDNLLSLNDLFYVNAGHDVFNGSSKGTSNLTAHFDVPIKYWLLGVTVSDSDYRQTVVGPFEQYVYSGSSRNAELRVARVLFRNAKSKFGVYGRGWWRKSDSFIDDVEIDVQRRRMAGWEAGLTHKQFMGPATLEASVAYRHGTGAFNALAAPEEPFGEGTSRFKLVTADAQLTAPFQIGRQRLRYTSSWRAQWNRTPLVPQDRFAIGGRYTVRGFDGEVSLTGERGWLLRNDVAVVLDGSQELYVGLDRGHVSGPSTRRQLGNNLAGFALGLRGGWAGLGWDGFIGAPLSKPDGLPVAYTTFGLSMNWSF